MAFSDQFEEDGIFDDQEKLSKGGSDDQAGVHQNRDDHKRNRGGSEITRESTDITIRY